MTSRRPMTRSFSGNGRTSSFSEEEGSSSNGRTESRNPYLSNVRPENRSTLCSVMAQLTEDIQPSFETTLKSKAVSEKCNVKFSCVVSGYPAPELKWYKDDMELDRYCGLPKYEIHRNGKTHTLQIYDCTLDDAAIYQVSASNSKGIVSCSGVLEVGTMNEFQIHQRFFAKLKQKAEKKKKDLEDHTKKGDKEVPERPPRKRHVPPSEEKTEVNESEAVEQLGAAAEPNGVSAEVKEVATSKDQEKEISPPEETLAKKKIKITNGVDAGVDNSNRRSSRSNMMGNGGENGYDGGLGLAQFLAETLQSQSVEENQNSPRGEKPKDTDMHNVSASKEKEKEKEQERLQKVREEQEKVLKEEYERERRREEELAIEKEKERKRLLNMSHTVPHTKHGSGVKHHSKAHKDHDHHNIQASISSVLHTVKDFFFGKGKKDSHDHTEERGTDHSPASTPPSRLHSQVCRPLTEDVVPMEIDQPKEPSETVDIEQKSVKEHEHNHEESVLHTDPPPADILPHESVTESTGQSVKAADGLMEAMEVTVGQESNSPAGEMSLSGLQDVTEAEEKDSQIAPVVKEDPVHKQEPECLGVSPDSHHQAVRDESSPREETAVLQETQVPDKDKCPSSSSLTSLEENWTSPQSLISGSNSRSFGKATTEPLPEEMISVEKVGKECESSPEEGQAYNKLCEEEKGEVKSNKQPCLDIKRSELTELTTSSLEVRIEPCCPETPDHVFPLLPAVACNVERENVKEQTKYTPLVQEMNVGLPTTAARESIEEADLKTQQACASSIGEENSEVHNVSKIKNSNKEFQSSEEGSNSKEVLITALDLEVKPVILESENNDTRNDSLLLEEETEKRVDNFNDSERPLETKENNGGNACVLVEHSHDAYQDSSTIQQVQPTANIPLIQISTIDDTPDDKTAVVGENQNECFIIPKIEIMEPDLKEFTLPITILALNQQESETAMLAKYDETHVPEVIIQDHSVADSSSLLHTQKSMQNKDSPSLTETLKEVAQLGDTARVTEMEQPSVKRSEQLPQMDFAKIPVINVLCTDDKENDVYVNTPVLDTQQSSETPSVPLFVVPPISVTCHESDTELAAQSEWTDREPSAVMQRATEHDDIDITAPEKTQSKEENTEEKSKKENTPFGVEISIPNVDDNILSINKTREDNVVPEVLKTKPIKEAKTDNSVSAEDLKRNRSSVERLCSKPPAHPSLSPASLRKFMSKATADSDDKADEDLSGGSTPTTSLSRESSPRLKRRDSLTLIRSATPEELASGARRKIFIPKTKEDGEGTLVGLLDTQNKKETPYMSPSQARRAALLQTPTGQGTPPMERRSPLLSRRKATLEVPKLVEEPPAEEPVSTKQEEKPAEKKLDPFKAPQVIRKIRGEPFPDASGHLKLWCQFFNVLSDATIKWYRDEEEILELKRSGGDESQVALAIVLASSHDCGVYGCSITNEYGTDITDFLLSVDILSEILLKDDLEVGEEIEMTPLLFSKGLADCGNWGEKYFGRIMTETADIGEGCAHKASRVKVIYGLDPIFESGSACIIKVQSPIAYGTMKENTLTERNLQITKHECKVQNMIREYCKIFAAEARVIENFGFSLEVIAQYLMYRPANSVPYASVEAYLDGDFVNYCTMDAKGKLFTRTATEVEQKCSTFQHWIHQWTHGNLLVTRLEGVETKITNIRVVTKSKGYQGLTERGSPEVFEQFLTHHQCNYYCGLLGLRPLKSMDSLQQPTKTKGSRSPLLNRKLGSGSPQLQRKGHSPQMSRKANSPKVTRKTEDNKSEAKPKPAETVVLETR